MATDDDRANEALASDQVDEPRARDLLDRPRGAPLPDGISPDVAAQLARWFGMESLGSQMSTSAATGPGVTAEVDDDSDDGARRAAAIAAVDPLFRAHLERHTTTPFSTQISKLAVHKLRLAPDRSAVSETFLARASSIAEPREVDIPEQLQDDLRDCQPQAILRDLERPVFDFALEFEHAHEEELEAVDGIDTVRSIMATKFSGVFLPLGSREMTTRQHELAALMNIPWAELPSLVPFNYRREGVS